MADTGFDGEVNRRFGREVLGADSLIPAKKCRSVRVVAITPYRSLWRTQVTRTPASDSLRA